MRAVLDGALEDRLLDEPARLHLALAPGAADAAGARALMLAQPSIIKRPVVVWADGTVTVGFSDAAFQTRVA